MLLHQNPIFDQGKSRFRQQEYRTITYLSDRKSHLIAGHEQVTFGTTGKIFRFNENLGGELQYVEFAMIARWPRVCAQDEDITLTSLYSMEFLVLLSSVYR